MQPEVFTPSGKLHSESSWLCHGRVVPLWGQGSLLGGSQRVGTKLGIRRGTLCSGALSLLWSKGSLCRSSSGCSCPQAGSACAVSAGLLVERSGRSAWVSPGGLDTSLASQGGVAASPSMSSPADAWQSMRMAPACPAGWPAVSTPVLRSLAGKPGAALRALKEEYGVDLHVAGGHPAQCSSHGAMLLAAQGLLANHTACTAHGRQLLCPACSAEPPACRQPPLQAHS